MKNLIYLCFCLILAIPCQARIITVDDDGPADFNNIQAGIDDSNEGDIIIVADGTYTGPGNRDIDFFGKPITVRSSDPNDPNIVAATIIDCNGTGSEPHRGFRFWQDEDANSVVAGLTIINGYAPITSPHRVATGGAIDCLNSSPTIRQCAIRDNLAGVGGGIYCGKSESVISKCEITGNSARYGGGIRLHTCQSEIKNCLITDNTAWERNGGGIIVSFSDATITNCTISNNVADRRISGGMYCDEATVTITNCIFWDNSPSEILEGPGGNATATYCDIKGGWPGEGNIEADPCFVDANNGDYYLLADSLCIDAGDPNFVPELNETDLDGNPRVVDGDNDGNPVVDMGAYERIPGPAELIAQLLGEVGGLGLPSGIENGLEAKLNAALRALEDENENNDAAAVNTLEAFINAVEAQRGKKIPEEEADVLIAAALEIIELLSDS